MTEAFMAKAALKFADTLNVVEAMNQVMKGAEYYGEKVREIVNGTPSIDGPILAATMRSVVTSLESTFDDHDRMMEQAIMQHTTVIRAEMPIDGWTDD